ncbi:MFS family permease [Halalkaliarchaeum sp. AArc-CO]|uniref:MFS transporter n=1 Tax=Halalkaliarchaeum sp. AArc-CO TaxID=2866381 RepID=UPI00217DC2A9|nr:MFS transporter [Halalkaliarchaeum sp. AArc-CO]UWG50812.1 MFS family permease [Halalkaliarchaeum sp. AArc-CO]
MELLSDPKRRRWLGWGSLIGVFLLVNVHRLSTAVLSEELIAAFGVTASQLGTLHASFFVIYALVQIPTGILADRYGARFVGTAGAITLSAGAVGFALSTGYLAAFLSRALIGLGSGVIFISTIRFCANWFRAGEFATMTGLTAGMAGLGAIIATTPLAMLIGALGWRPTILAFAAVGFLAGGGVWVLVRRSPAEAGLEPIENVPEASSVTLAETLGNLRRLLADPDQWLLSIVFFSAMGTILTVIGLWGVPYLVVVHDLDVTTASYFTLIGAVGMLLGGPVVGWISDRLGRRLLPMIVGLGLFTVALAVIPVSGSPPLPVVALAYFVIGLGLGFTALALPVIKELYPAEASGVATATVNGAGFLGAAVLPPVMGIALDQYRTGEIVAGAVVYSEFGYRIAFAITTVAVALSVCCAIWFSLRQRDSA